MIPKRLAWLLPAALAAGAAQGFIAAAAKEATPNPHGAFVEDCALCHGPEGWRPAVISPAFDHGKRGFPLEGSHRRVPCLSCHTKPDFSSASSECVVCHADVHRGELGPDCARCHATTSFVERADEVRSHRMSRFPLTGAHLGTDCRSCHRYSSSGHLVFVNTSAECASCHLDDYTATRSPDHAAAGFPRECEQCHSTSSWSGRSFNHAVTGFALSGAHRSLACDSCHTAGGFSGVAPECVACHQADYDQAANPDHRSGGFPLECADCHSTSSWQGAKFDHSTTRFPLTGAHRGLSCADCHTGGVLTGLSPDCVACHQADYDQTTDPAHRAAVFPTDCTDCHTTSSWQGASFDHNTWFPIYSGAHAGEWSRCSECHINAANYSDFTCLSCHPHSDKAKTDDDHRGESGYVYDSHECYSCHPNGRH